MTEMPIRGTFRADKWGDVGLRLHEELLGDDDRRRF